MLRSDRQYRNAWPEEKVLEYQEPIRPTLRPGCGQNVHELLKKKQADTQ
jgi:hypothetical protein